MRMSSKYTTTKELMNKHKISSIIVMNVVGVLFKTKGLFILEGFIPYIDLFNHKSVVD